MTTIKIGLLNDGSSDEQLSIHIDPFLEHLRNRGYAERTLRKKRTTAVAFVKWMQRERSEVTGLEEADISAFVQRSQGV